MNRFHLQSTIRTTTCIVNTRPPIESSDNFNYHDQEEEEERDKIQFHVELNGDALLSSSSSSSECEDGSQDGSFHDLSDQQSADLEFTACHPSDDENDVYEDEQLEEDRKPAHKKETTYEDSDDDDLLKPSPWAKSKASKQRKACLLEDDIDNEDLNINNSSLEESQGDTCTIHYGLRSPPPYPRNILSKPKNSPRKSSVLKDYIESSSDEDLKVSTTKIAAKITPKSIGKKKMDESKHREIICLDDDSEDDATLIHANDIAPKRSERHSLMPQHWGSSGMKKRSNVSTSFSTDLRRKPISLSDINYSRNDLTGGSGLGLGGFQVLKGGTQYADHDDSDDDDQPGKKSTASKSKRSKTTRKASTKTKSKGKRSKSSFKRRRSGGYKASGRSRSDWNTTQQGIRPYNGEESSNVWGRGRQRGTRLGEVNLDPRLGNLGGATIQF